MDRSAIRFRGLLLWMFRVSWGLVGSIVMSMPVMAESGSGYDDVLNALQGGRTVTVLIDFSQCASLDTGKSGPSLQGGLQIRSFLVLPDNGVVFSDVHQTLDRSGQPVTEYIRYNLKANGEVTLAVTRQTASGMVKQDPLSCHISAGAQFVW
jgi:hypothetical protein